jgi:hypothetical protein
VGEQPVLDLLRRVLCDGTVAQMMSFASPHPGRRGVPFTILSIIQFPVRMVGYSG